MNEIELVTDVLNMIISSLDERKYLRELKKVINNIDTQDKEFGKVKEYLATILTEDITSKKEALSELDDKFDSSIISRLNLTGARYSMKYKENFLKNLNVERFLRTVNHFTNIINEDLLKLGTARSDKVKSQLMDLITNTSKELQDELVNQKIRSDKSTSFIIDPNNKELTIENLSRVIETSNQIDNQTIKTFPGFDIVVNGGLKLGTTTLIVAKPSGFKSGLLQNICIYAMMNNTPDKFDVPPGKVPAIFFISLENTERQLYQRHLSFFLNSSANVKEITKNMSTIEIAEYVSKMTLDNAQIHLPIIYIDRFGSETDMDNIAAEISEYEQLGYHPVLLGIDYLTKLTTIDPKYRNYSDVSMEGARKQAKKSDEIRRYCKSRNIACVVPEQLSSDAINILESLRPECRRVDPLYSCTLDMINGSRDLSKEYENVIFIYKSEIASLEMGTDTTKVDEYISLINKKTREEKSLYVLSNRDKINGPLVEIQTKKLKAGPLREKMKETADLHVVMPLIGYRISDTDYAKTIRAFYVNDNTDCVSLSDLMQDSHKLLTDISDVFSETNNKDKMIGDLLL